jgi:hypothetical protein
MRIATLEEVKDIGFIAEEKLSTYKQRVSSEDYKSVLVLTMHEIARDMGLEIPGDLKLENVSRE